MPVKLGADSTLMRRRAKVESEFLPDVCHIAPFARTTDAAGGWGEGLGDYLTYGGSPDIPCRLDPTRHYRKEDIFGQELIVNEYTMWLPHTVPVKPDMMIEKDGTRFEVRKLLNRQSRSVLQSVLLAVLE
jgi:hypothetical protein